MAPGNVASIRHRPTTTLASPSRPRWWTPLSPKHRLSAPKPPRRGFRPRSQPDTARNLLFGILALQNNFIDRDGLLAAFNAWAADKARPLGRILVEQGALDASRHALLEALVPSTSSSTATTPSGAWPRSARSAGAHATGAIADPDLAVQPRPRRRARPDGDRRRRDPELGRRADVRRSRGSASSGRTPRAAWARSSSPATRSCTARSPSSRSRSRHADDPDSRARFLLEAEITGGLEHPGIVPVYGLGHYDDGRPFYAMRFIKGDSLNDAIERFHEADGTRSATPASGRWPCGGCCGGSSTSATRSPTPTAAACCTAT